MELRYTVVRLEKPVVLAVVGTGDAWRFDEVRMSHLHHIDTFIIIIKRRPHLFLIDINDITQEVQSSDNMSFCRCTTLYVIADNPVDSADAFNCDVKRVTEWSE